MPTFFLIILLSLMGATLLVLAAGLIFMALGGERNKRLSTILMIARISLQALAILLLCLLFAAR